MHRRWLCSINKLLCYLITNKIVNKIVNKIIYAEHVINSYYSSMFSIEILDYITNS